MSLWEQGRQREREWDDREVGAEGGLRIDGEVEGDREQELGVDEVQQQPRRFGRRWANFVRSLLDDARM